MREFERLLAEYLDAAGDQVLRMRAWARSASPEDLGSLRWWAHRFRGSGLSFGFPEISRLAGTIEDLVAPALAAGTLPEESVVSLCDQLVREVARARLGRGAAAPAAGSGRA